MTKRKLLVAVKAASGTLRPEAVATAKKDCS